MALQVVSLLAVLLVTSARGQFPMLGGFSMGSPYMSGYSNPNQHNQHNQQLVDPNLLTCIKADAQDPQSQIRLTLRPLNPTGGLGGHPAMGLGFGQMGPFSSPDRQQDWTVDGLMLSSQQLNKAGSYRVAVFSGGRTFGQCKMTALGQVLDTGSLNPLSQAMRMGPFSPFRGMGGMGGFSPLGGMLGMHNGGYTQPPNGEASNNALIPRGGTTMYSGVIRGVSFNDLVGRSVGVCQTIQGGKCYGQIAYCCSITRDALPASEVYVEQTAGLQQPNPMGFTQAGGGFIGGAQPGVNSQLGGTGLGVATVVGGDNGLF